MREFVYVWGEEEEEEEEERRLIKIFWIGTKKRKKRGGEMNKNICKKYSTKKKLEKSERNIIQKKTQQK